LEQLNSVVAANLKRLRAERQISLDRLAELTGVSKSMLGQIERGETSPTITTIWKIANGLKVSFSAFLEKEEPASQLVDPADITPLIEDEGKYTILPYFCVDGQKNFEIFSMDMKPGGQLEAEPHFAGTQEYIIIYSGALTIWVDGMKNVVKTGQAFRFDADVKHGYSNESTEDMKGCMVLYYPK
jgi:transcriptional regulator with XRE-family HTH domain